MQELSLKFDCCVVTVDYRLAPETLCSGSLEDTYAGLKWLHSHAGELGVNPKNLAVLGGLIHPEQLEALAFKYDHLKKTLGINQTQKPSNL
jgi:hypothetical protein